MTESANMEKGQQLAASRAGSPAGEGEGRNVCRIIPKIVRAKNQSCLAKFKCSSGTNLLFFVFYLACVEGVGVGWGWGGGTAPCSPEDILEAFRDYFEVL